MDNLWDFFQSFEGIDSETGAILTFLVFWVIFCGIIAFIAWIFKVISRWIFFKKCGEAGWKALIPVYDEIILVKLSGLNWWWIFIIYAASIYSILQLTISIPMVAFQSIGMSMVSFMLSMFSYVVSIATIIAKVNEANNLARKFNKGAGHAALIFFFEPIMFLVMGLSKDYEYDTKADVSPNGFFGGR